MTFIEIVGTNATLAHQYVIIAMVGLSTMIYTISILYAMKAMKRKNAEIKLLQQQHAARIDVIRKENTDFIERTRLEMLKKEEERNRQWMESEKETLHVLNGVSMLLDLNEKIGKIESEKILDLLDAIHCKVESLTEFGNNLEVLSIIKERVEVLAIIKEKVEVLDLIKEKVEKLSLTE